MDRRKVLKALASLPLCGLAVANTPVKKLPLGLVIHSYAVRGSRPLPPEFPAISSPLEFVEYSASLGVAGVQTRIGVLEPIQVDRLRKTIEQLGMYLEGIIALPRDDADLPRFTTEVECAKAVGAGVLRTVCLSGRRYETFASADEFAAFAERSWKSLRLAEPVVARHGIRLAVENHKDWRVDELLGWLEKLGSEFVGVCLDTGNSIALLEEPHAVVDAYAPWTFTTHLKDMGVVENDEGFLLSEVPLGEGFLDVPRIVKTLRKARPEVRLNLEMITRDPLRVPCLTRKFWTTMNRVPAIDLAETLVRVRKHRFPGALPTVSQLSHAEQLRTEADNIARCLRFAGRTL